MLLRFAILTLFSMGLCSCNPTKMTEVATNADNTAYINTTSSVLVNLASPASGNVLLDQTGGIAVNNGSGIVRVRLHKYVGAYEYDLYVYFNRTTAAVTHVSLSWTTDNRATYLNAFSTSPAGVVVDLNNKTISFMNTQLSSGLPSTANLNGQYKFEYR